MSISVGRPAGGGQVTLCDPRSSTNNEVELLCMVAHEGTARIRFDNRLSVAEDNSIVGTVTVLSF